MSGPYRWFLLTVGFATMIVPWLYKGELRWGKMGGGPAMSKWGSKLFFGLFGVLCILAALFAKSA